MRDRWYADNRDLIEWDILLRLAVTVEARRVHAIWNAMNTGDVFAFYQHQTNRAGQPWTGPKPNQLAHALGVQLSVIRIAHAGDIAKDVGFFFTQRA